jgi:hypothetical protein
MSVPDNEKVYDEQIAPLMERIIAVCEEHGLPMIAEFEYAEEHNCLTAIIPENASNRMRNLAYIHSFGHKSIGKGGTPAPRGNG